jgi:hypothetical protein
MPHRPARFRPVVAAMAAGLTCALCLPAYAQVEREDQVEAGARAEAAPMTKGEKRLAKLLEGRVAGEPVRCISTFPSQRMQTINRTAYVYGQGSTIYLQRTRDPERINDTDALVTNRFNATQLCRLDVFNTIDRVNGMFTGAVFFEDFVPYTRSAQGEADGD